MSSFPELQYQIALTLLPGIGPASARRILSNFKSASGFFNEKPEKLIKQFRVTAQVLQAMKNAEMWREAEREVRFLTDNGYRPIFYTDESYPARMRNCEDAPVLLYTQGDTNLNNQKVLAIVGTRNATPQGREICEKIIDHLKDYKLLIVSGLAFGIDTQAHQSALDHGLHTAAVMGTGLDSIYPAKNKRLAEHIAQQGMLISEFRQGTKPDKENFPQRNRIVAGMSDAILVVEAAERGGALITAEIALSYNRDVLAVPGRPTDHYSRGCNYLIRNNKAALVQSGEDIEYLLGWEKTTEDKQRTQTMLFAELSEEEMFVAGILREKGKITLDELMIVSEKPLSKLVTLLLEMELKGAVRALPGKQYELI
jgi:DNA processing protein